MQPEDYQGLTGVTEISNEAYDVAAVRLQSVKHRIEHLVSSIFVAGQELETIKKWVFHGKVKPSQKTAFRAGQLEHNVAHATSPMTAHYVMGILGEVSEVVEAAVTGTPEDVQNEVGDLLYYLTRLLELNELQLGKTMRGNIDKLAKRYPELHAGS